MIAVAVILGISFLFFLVPKWYWLNLLEACSQVINAIHAGDPNQTFSARLAAKRDSGEFGFPAWYWQVLIWSFETFWPGHLDWAKGPD